MWINEKDISFSTSSNSDSFFENQDLEWCSRCCEMSFFHKLILRLCLLHTVSFNDLLSDVIGVTSNYSADSALSNCQSNSAYLF